MTITACLTDDFHLEFNSQALQNFQKYMRSQKPFRPLSGFFSTHLWVHWTDTVWHTGQRNLAVSCRNQCMCVKGALFDYCWSLSALTAVLALIKQRRKAFRRVIVHCLCGEDNFESNGAEWSGFLEISWYLFFFPTKADVHIFSLQTWKDCGMFNSLSHNPRCQK